MLDTLIGVSPFAQIGSVLNQTTAPIITLPTIASITDVGMTVGATVNPGGESTVWSVEYGLTIAYGSTASGGTITEETIVTKALTGLAENTLYYWRIKAVNTKGTTYSDRQTATTINSELVVYITGLTTPLSAGQKTKLNIFISSLKSGLSIAALSDTFDGMYLLGGETAESSLKNIVKNAHHATAVNSPTFTALEGFTGNGTTSYLDLNYNILNDKVRYAQNSGGVGIYSRTNLAGTRAQIGALTATTGVNGTVISNRNAADQFSAMVNAINSGILMGANTNSQGMYIISRVNSTYNAGYKNKTQVANAAKNSSAIPNAQLFVCCRSIGTVPDILSTQQLSFAFVSLGLSQENVNVITDAIEAYMDSNGKGVIA